MAEPGGTRRLSVNVAASALGQMAGKLSTLVWTFVAARELSASSLGAYFYAYALAGLASAAAEWGFDPALIERAAREPSSVDAEYTRAQLSQTLLAVPAFGAATAVAVLSRHDAQGRIAVAAVCLAVLFDLWTDTARSAGAAVRNQVPTSQALIVQRWVTAVAVVAAVAAGTGLLGLCLAFLGGSVIGVIAHQVALRRLGIRLVRDAVSIRALVSTFVDCATLGVTVVVLMALFRLDAVVLGILRGQAAVADYSVAYRLFESALFLTYSVQGATFAVMAAYTDRRDVGRELARGFRLAGAVYAVFLAVCLVDAPGVLGLLFGDRYSGVSSGALRWLAAAPLCYLAAALASSALQAIRRRREILAASVAALVANVALNALLIPSTGGTGAAFATTASYAVLGVIALWRLHRARARVHLGHALTLPLVVGGAAAGLLVALPAPTIVEVPVTLVLVAAGVAIVFRRRPELLTGTREPAHLMVRTGDSVTADGT